MINLTGGHLKNFLTTSLEPGMETFQVMGAVCDCVVRQCRLTSG